MHANELGPAILACHLVEVRELPAPHRTRADVAHFTALNEVMEGFHRFFGRNLGVVPVYLEKIEVRGLQARERGVNCVEDGRTGEATLVDIPRLVLEAGCEDRVDADIVGNESIAFRGDHDLVTGDLILGRDGERCGGLQEQAHEVPFG